MDDGKTVFDWGQGPAAAPSIKRARPLDWLLACGIAGLFLAVAAMRLSWRDLPALPAPPGSFGEHAAYALESLLHAISGHYFAAEARYYAEALSRFTQSQWTALTWRCALGLAAFCMPAALTFKSFLKGRDGLIHLRGSTRHSGEEAKRRIDAELRLRAKARPDHEIAPGVPYPGDLWTRHVLMAGGTGSGKSTALKPLIAKVVAAKEQVLLFDPKGEFTESFPEPSIIAPWDARSLAWDIAKDMRNVIDMRRFAAAVIRESQDPMWSNASRQLLVGVMIYLKKTRGDGWGWMELKELIALPQAQLLSIMQEWHPEAVRAVEKASVTTSGILINLASFCSSIFDLAEAWGDAPPSRRVSFVEWTLGRSKHRQIILQGHGAYAELTKAYAESIVGIISAIVNSIEMDEDPSRKIWFIADEFGQCGKLPVRALFEVGRGRGVRCVVACQDFAQLEEIYGEAMIKALLGMCGTLLIGQIMQGDTAETLCKTFGVREVERANLSSSLAGGAGQSSTLSYSRDEVPLYKPSELTSRLGLAADGQSVTMLLFTGGHAYELSWPLFPKRSRRPRHKPAPWTTQLQTEFRGDAFAARKPPEAAVPESSREVDGLATLATSATDVGRPTTDGAVASVASSTEAGGAMAADLPRDHAQERPDFGQASGQAASPPHEAEIEPAAHVELALIPISQPASAAGGHAHEQAVEHGSPLFDAAAELALLKLGAPIAATAIEAVAAVGATATPGGPSLPMNAVMRQASMPAKYEDHRVAK